jgi:tRNA 2-thiouridine synthesizing protein A
MSDMKLDVKGKMCPLPVALTKRGLAALVAGQTLEVTGTGDLEFDNIQRWLKNNGQEIVAASRQGGEFKLLIKKH